SAQPGQPNNTNRQAVDSAPSTNPATVNAPNSLVLPSSQVITRQASRPVLATELAAYMSASVSVGGLRHVGDEHVRRRVGDRERDLGLEQRCLRGDAAGPEHRQLTGPHLDGRSEIRG